VMCLCGWFGQMFRGVGWTLTHGTLADVRTQTGSDHRLTYSDDSVT
jgi:hypothetical protein